jgi:fucose 4-O-acetylase-like acetyltransferase
VFFSLGYYLKQGMLKIKINKMIIRILAIIAILINTLAIYSPTMLDKIFRNEYILNHGIIYYIALLILAFSGIYVVTSIAKIIKRQKILEFLGRNSLSFFGLHVLFF